VSDEKRMTLKQMMTLLRVDCDHPRHTCKEVGCLIAKVGPMVSALYAENEQLKAQLAEERHHSDAAARAVLSKQGKIDAAESQLAALRGGFERIVKRIEHLRARVEDGLSYGRRESRPDILNTIDVLRRIVVEERAALAAPTQHAGEKRGKCIYPDCTDDAKAIYPVCYRHRNEPYWQREDAPPQPPATAAPSGEHDSE